LLGILSGNRYSQVLNPLLTGKDIGRNNLREQILTCSLHSLQVDILVGIISGNRYPQVLTLSLGRDIGRNNLREQIPSGF
jgi:hypothetical protein